ncbi:MAG TPA: hypothetical protein ENN63_05440 [Bacteroidetes bacterium]|nr:hypothetical protein [Bacteroidota bacterium]
MKTKRNISFLVAFLFAASLKAAPAIADRDRPFDATGSSPFNYAPQVMISEYYTGHDGFHYASRIRRFHRPLVSVRVGYYDPFFTDMYWYGSGFYAGTSIYWGLPYWYYSPNYVQVVYHTPLFYWNDYYDPWYGGVHIRFHIGYPRYYTPFREVYYVGYGGLFASRVVYRTRIHYRYIPARPAVYHTWYNTRPVYYSHNSYIRKNPVYRSRETYHTRDPQYARTTTTRRGSGEANRAQNGNMNRYRNRETVRAGTSAGEGNRNRITNRSTTDTHRSVLTPPAARRERSTAVPVTRQRMETQSQSGRSAVIPARTESRSTTRVTTRSEKVRRSTPPAVNRTIKSSSARSGRTAVQSNTRRQTSRSAVRKTETRSTQKAATRTSRKETRSSATRERSGEGSGSRRR